VGGGSGAGAYIERGEAGGNLRAGPQDLFRGAAPGVGVGGLACCSGGIRRGAPRPASLADSSRRRGQLALPTDKLALTPVVLCVYLLPRSISSHRFSRTQ
jgi:hypothetical protein